MIVVDSSAVIGIVLEEPASDEMLVRLLTVSERSISATNVMEVHMVMSSRGIPGWPAALDEFLARHLIGVRVIDDEQLRFARAAFDRFGKGQGHPARLNFGDCFAYALAKSLGARLLYRGDDFAQTDIESAIA